MFTLHSGKKKIRELGQSPNSAGADLKKTTKNSRILTTSVSRLERILGAVKETSDLDISGRLLVMTSSDKSTWESLCSRSFGCSLGTEKHTGGLGGSNNVTGVGRQEQTEVFLTGERDLSTERNSRVRSSCSRCLCCSGGVLGGSGSMSRGRSVLGSGGSMFGGGRGDGGIFMERINGKSRGNGKSGQQTKRSE